MDREDGLMKQKTLFDEELEYDIEVKRHAKRSGPATSKEAAKELAESGRASKQCQLILEMLQKGPVNSAMLAAVSLKYTARISDLRQDGHTIKAERHGEVWWYTLCEEK
jgi:hypothetical protein